MVQKSFRWKDKNNGYALLPSKINQKVLFYFLVEFTGK